MRLSSFGRLSYALTLVALASPLRVGRAQQTRAPRSAGAPSPQHAAPLYMPRAVEQAYANGTRAYDGRPGPKYWQNHARYRIDVSVAPPARQLTGTEEVVYHNNSPDALAHLVVRLFPNAHKPGAPRDTPVPPDWLTSGVHIDSALVNGKRVDWGDDAGTFTVKGLQLPAPLASRDSLSLTIAWHYDLSSGISREGAIDPKTFFLAYFYPRIAVYDDYNGWDTMPFVESKEFYSDFNDYDVTVRAPANFMVWGTGTLRNAADVLQPAALARFTSSLTSNETVHVATAADLASRAATAQGGMLAWHFTAQDIADVAFAVSDHYVWDAGSVVVDSSTMRRASVQAAFEDSSDDYHHMVRYGQHALDWLSRKWPGVPYPFEKTTVVQGFADMEYPMMVNDEAFPDTIFARFVAEHEIAHSWFPFYMGINESRYAFMDEGWATTFEYLIGINDLGKDGADEAFKNFRVRSWITDAAPSGDIPIITPADNLSGGAYGVNAYVKPALGYLALKEMLGDETFRRALHAFIERWHGKHPIPWDFFNTVNDVSGRNLDWFWNAWYFGLGHIDLAVSAVQKSAGGYTIAVDNMGGLPAPFDVVVTFADGSKQTLRQDASRWETNQRRALVPVATRQRVTNVQLQGGIWMDADPSNDEWKAPR